MKAIHHTAYGAPDVLALAEAARPVPRANEVLVAIRASAVTHGDRRLRAADFPGIGWLPGRMMTGLFGPRRLVPGTTFAGRVVEVGSAVTRFAIGDDVFGLGTHGAYAEYLAVPEAGAIARKPPSLDHTEAAAMPYGATTALTFLRDLGKVQAGERVAVVGASGEVGRYAVQLARHLGAEVTGVCSRDHDLVAELGAHQVIDYTREDFTANGRRYDVVFDTSDTDQFGRCRGSLTPGGRYLSINLTLRGLGQMAMTSMFGGPRSICGVSIADREKLETVRQLVEAGAMRSVIAGRFPLERTADAHTFHGAGRSRGSVVVEVGGA